MGFRIAAGKAHIEVAAEGFFNAEEVLSHFARVGPMLAEQRVRLGRARVIVNATGGQPQSADVAHLMSESTAKLCREDDRVALLVPSALLRMQIKRVLTNHPFEVFSDRGEALSYVAS